MTPMRAVYWCDAYGVGVGAAATGIAVNRAVSQELSMRNELIPQPEPGSMPGTIAPAVGAIQTSNLLPAAKSQVGTLWQSRRSSGTRSKSVMGNSHAFAERYA